MAAGPFHPPAPAASPPLPPVQGRPWPTSPPVWEPGDGLPPPPPPAPEERPMGLAVWTSVIAAAALLAVVVALAVTSRGHGDGTGRFDADLEVPGRVLSFEVTLERGDVLDVHVAPDAHLDVAFGYALDATTVAEDFRQLVSPLATLEDYLADLRALDTLFVATATEHGWYVLYPTDREGPGTAEQDVLLAGADGTYRVLVRGTADTTGHAVVDLERARRQELLDDRARYEQVMVGSRLPYENYLALFG